jgi:hypothetical protein
MKSQPPPSIDKLEAALRELEGERQRRIAAGNWTRDSKPTLYVSVPRWFGTEPNVWHVSALYAHLCEYPYASKNIDDYHIVVNTTDEPPWVKPEPRPAPIIDEQVLPQFARLPPPPPPEPPPKTRSRRNFEREVERTNRFLSDEWKK